MDESELENVLYNADNAMRLICCVQPQGKALNVCLIVYEMYRLPNIVNTNANQSAHALRANCFGA